MRWLLASFDNARIRNKVLTGFTTVVLPLVALGVATLWASGSVRDHFDRFGMRQLPQYAATHAVEASTLRLLGAFNRAVSVTLANRMSRYTVVRETAGVRWELRRARNDLEAAVKRLEALPAGSDGDAAELRTQIRYIAYGVIGQIDLALPDFGSAPPDQILARASAMQQTGETLKDSIDQLRRTEAKALATAAAELDGTIGKLHSLAIGGIALALVTALVAGLLIAQRIARPIQNLREAAVELGDGDFAALDNQRRSADEIGDLVGAFQETARKLLDSQEKLSRNERLSALGQVAGTVSHELRNPLGTIRNSMGIVRQLTASKGLGIERALDRIDRSVERCNAIVSDILEFTRVQELNRETTPIDAWLDEMLDEHEVPAGVTLRRALDARATVMLDATRFRQVLVNLIDNAAQAMTDGEWTAPADRAPAITVRTEAAGPHVRLSIEDNGPGIAQDKLGKIFEPLFTTKAKGVGLGLPTVRKLIEQHGGTIDVESMQGEGTTFTVWLPRQPGQPSIEPAVPLAATA